MVDIAAHPAEELGAACGVGEKQGVGHADQQHGNQRAGKDERQAARIVRPPGETRDDETGGKTEAGARECCKALHFRREIEHQRTGNHKKRRAGIQPQGGGRGEGIARKPLQHTTADGRRRPHIDGNQRAWDLLIEKHRLLIAVGLAAPERRQDFGRRHVA